MNYNRNNTITTAKSASYLGNVGYPVDRCLPTRPSAAPQQRIKVTGVTAICHSFVFAIAEISH